jgi:flagellin
MIINHNLSAIYSHRQLKLNDFNSQKSMEKLSSGLRINRAGDDASGLAVSEKMRSQIRGLRRAAMNAEDDISFIQTTEGYLQNTQSILQRIRELAVQSANGVYTNEDRIMIQVEVSQLIDEIDRIASHAQFNTLNMLTGRYAKPGTTAPAPASMWFHIGANMDQRERVFIATMTAKALGMKDVATDELLSLSTPNKANKAISDLDNALMKVSKQRADLGAYQNRLEFAVQGIMNGYENLQAAESRIRDTDMAEQSIKFAKDQILLQTGTAMLAQANVKPQLVLQLLR